MNTGHEAEQETPPLIKRAQELLATPDRLEQWAREVASNRHSTYVGLAGTLYECPLARFLAQMLGFEVGIFSWKGNNTAYVLLRGLAQPGPEPNSVVVQPGGMGRAVTCWPLADWCADLVPKIDMGIPDPIPVFDAPYGGAVRSKEQPHKPVWADQLLLWIREVRLERAHTR